MPERSVALQNDREAQDLFGRNDEHLRRIEQTLRVRIVARNGSLTVSGEAAAVERGARLFEGLLLVVRAGQPVRRSELEYALKTLSDPSLPGLQALARNRIDVPSRHHVIAPKTAGQQAYVEALRQYDIVFAIGPAGTGKCVAGSTLVLTSAGAIPIETLGAGTTPQQYAPLHLDVAGLDGTERASHVYNGGRSSTKRIRTRLGFEIEVTPEHPLLQLADDGRSRWARADALRVGDYVAIQRGQRLFGRETAIHFQYRPNGHYDHAKPVVVDELDEELAYCVGLLIGDGCLTFRNRIILSSADAEILAAFTAMADRFGLHVFRNGGNRPYDRVIASSQLYQLLLHLGLSDGPAATKHVPQAVLRAPQSLVVAFLQGLFDTDGTVNRRDGYPQLASASKRLLDDVQFLLLNLGILANQRPKWTWYRDERRLSYQLEMTGSDADRFYEEVGFRLRRKQALRQTRDRNTNIDVVPPVAQVIRTAVAAGTFSRATHKSLDDYKQGRRRPGYDALGDIVALLERETPETPARRTLADLHDRRFFWADILDIQDSEAQVYDLTVPGSHAFCANGFVNHNTYLAMAMAISALTKGDVSRIILTRPAVEAGESLGFLPGDLTEKITPYLRPLYDALYDMLEVDKIQRYVDRGIIEVAPLAYMRGRAQPYFSAVLTPRGYVPIGNVQVGDAVVGADGAPTRVVGVYPQGRKEIFRVTMQDGASTLCCAEHLWAVYTRDDRRRNKCFRVLETRAMSERLRCAHYHRFELPLIGAPVQFSSRSVPLDPYALGLLLGDGCLTGTTTPSFATSDVELAHALGETLEGVDVARKSGVDYVLRNVHGGRGGIIVANPVTTALRDLHLCGARSSTKFIPEAYLYNTADVRLAVLQGLLDTDGGPVVQAGRTCRIHYGTTSVRLRDDVIFLVRSLGGIAYSRCRVAAGRRPGRANGRPVQHVSDAHILDIRLPAPLQPFRLSRKRARYQEHGGGRPVRYLDRIERVGEHEAVCIRVDAPDALYVTDDCIVTHNTLNDSFVILDEAQNTTTEQMKMFLTRLGFDSRAVITGDVTQVDLPGQKPSGLIHAHAILRDIEGIKFVQFSGDDVVRHELVQAIIRAYDTAEQRKTQRRMDEPMPDA